MSRTSIIYGHGKVEGDIAFTLTIVNPDYSVKEVQEKLLSGDLYAYYGDTMLYDEDKIEVVGTIEWGDDLGDFVVHEAVVPRIIANADGRNE